MDKLLFKRILIGGLTLLAVVYVLYLLLNINFGVYPTENAVEVTVTDKIYANAFIIRDETYVTNSSSGVVSYTVEDGDEVHSGGTVAKVYSTEEDAAARTKADTVAVGFSAPRQTQAAPSLPGKTTVTFRISSFSPRLMARI